MRLPAAALLLPAIFTALAVLLMPRPGAAEPGVLVVIDAFRIDMDPGASPANTATSTGTVESCARINNNGIVDADEDAADVVAVDLVAGPAGIPADHPLIGFEFVLTYNPRVVVLDFDPAWLLLSGGVGEIFEAFVDPLPDSDGSFRAAALDIGSNKPGNPGDVGPGVLARLLIGVDGAEDGLLAVSLVRTAAEGRAAIFAVDNQNRPLIAENMVDTDGDGTPDSVAEVARLAVDRECPSGPVPMITPFPPATPTTSPTASPYVMSTPGSPDATAPPPAPSPAQIVTPAAFPQTGARADPPGAGGLLPAAVIAGGALVTAVVCSARRFCG